MKIIIEQQITDEPDCLISSAEDKGASDMPVLDARFTPMHSPPSIDQAQITTKPEEDDDEAPPQLSPNIFVNFFIYFIKYIYLFFSLLLNYQICHPMIKKLKIYLLWNLQLH